MKVLRCNKFINTFILLFITVSLQSCIEKDNSIKVLMVIDNESAIKDISNLLDNYKIEYRYETNSLVINKSKTVINDFIQIYKMLKETQFSIAENIACQQVPNYRPKRLFLIGNGKYKITSDNSKEKVDINYEKKKYSENNELIKFVLAIIHRCDKDLVIL